MGLTTALILAAAYFSVLFYVRSDGFQNEIVKVMEEATGRKVVLEESMGVTVYPGFGLTTGPLSIYGDRGQEGEPFARADDVSVTVRIMPLFSSELVIDTVSFKNVSVAFRRTDDGRSNWKTLFESIREYGESATAGKKKGPGLGLSLVELGRIEVKGAEIGYVNDKSGRSFKIGGVHLSTGTYVVGNPLDFALGCGYADKEAGVDFLVNITGRLSAGLGSTGPLFEEANLHLTAGGDFLPEGQARAECVANIEYDLSSGLLMLDNFRAKVLGLYVTGKLQGSNFKDDFALTGQVAVNPFSPTRFINAVVPEAGLDPGSALIDKMSMSSEVILEGETLTMKGMKLNIDGMDVTGNAVMNGFVHPRFEFDLFADSLAFSESSRQGTVELSSEKEVSEETQNANLAKGMALDFGDLPLSFLRTFMADGRIRVKELKVDEYLISGFDLSMVAERGDIVLMLNPGRMFGGTMRAEWGFTFGKNVDADSSWLGTNGVISLKNADSTKLPLLADAGFSSQGKANIKVNFDFPLSIVKHESAMASLFPLARCVISANMEAGGLAMAEGQSGPASDVLPQGGSIDFSKADAVLSLVPVGIKPNGERSFNADLVLRAEREIDPFDLDLKLTGLVHANIEVEKYKFENVDVRAELTDGFLPGHGQTARITSQAEYDSVSKTLVLNNLTLKTSSGTVRGAFVVKNAFTDDYLATGKAGLFGASPQKVRSFFGLGPLEVPDPKVMKALTADTALTVSRGKVRLSDVAIKLDDIEVSGNLDITEFSKPNIKGELKVGNLDLDRYVYIEDPEEATKEGEGDKNSDDQITAAVPVKKKEPPSPLPLETMRELECSLGLSIDAFKCYDARVSNFRVSMTAKDGNIQIRPIESAFYGGVLAGSLDMNVGQNSLEARLDMHMDGFESGDFARDFWGQEYIKGNADMYYKLFSVCSTDEEVLTNLQGVAGFIIRDGSYKFSEYPDEDGNGKKAESKLRKRNSFREATANFKVAGGIMQNDDFNLSSSLMSGSGGGYINLPEYTIDVTLIADFVAAPDVPVQIVGDLGNPDVKVSTAEVLGNTVKDILTLPLRPFQYLRDLF